MEIAFKTGHNTLFFKLYKLDATTYVTITMIIIWPDPVSTSQVDFDLDVDVAEFGARSQSNTSKILVW